VYFGFQTVQLISERGNLGQVKSSQEAAIQEAQKVQTQFRNLVTKTGQLADQGHAARRWSWKSCKSRASDSPRPKPRRKPRYHPASQIRNPLNNMRRGQPPVAPIVPHA